MANISDSRCPECGGEVKYYDKVPRIVRTKEGNKEIIKIRRFRCTKCHRIHRKLPECILPYKQYKASIINKILENTTPLDTLYFENGPCDSTIERWIREFYNTYKK